jgi:hypothetical protein
MAPLEARTMGLQLKRAFGIVLLTRNYILYRAAAYAALCAGVIGYLGLLSLLGMVFGTVAFWVLLLLSAGIAVILAMAGSLGELFFYRLKAGHIALIARIMAGGAFPRDMGQVRWAHLEVFGRMGGFGRLSQLRAAVRKAVRQLNRAHFPYAAVMATGPEEGVAFGQRMIDQSQKYIEQSIFAYAFREKEDPLFASIRTALVLYCHCAPRLLRNAITLTLLGAGFFVVAAVIFLAPLGLAALAIPKGWALFKFVLFASGIFLGLSAKWAIYDPMACASTILTFFDETELVAPDKTWEQRVSAVGKDLEDLEAQLQKNAPGTTA